MYYGCSRFVSLYSAWQSIVCSQKRLNERDKKDVSTDTLAELTELVLKSNFFNFRKTYETKKRYSNWDKVCSTLKYFIYGRIGRKILEIADNKSYLWWRYIDDIFFIREHGEKKLRNSVEALHEIHPTIKFNAKWS